jgi:mycothione reductase
MLGTMRHFDLAVIGSGSGDSLVDHRFRDWNVALTDDLAVGFGGTCLNVGCIPSKMFVYTADLAAASRGADAFGLEQQTTAVHWRQIRQRVFDRIDRLSAESLRHRREGRSNVTLFEGEARFSGPNTLQVGGGAETISADRFVIAAGSRPIVPTIPGLTESGFLTNETVMRIDELPRRLVILGAGAIAAEFAHVFSSLGVQITVIARSEGMLRKEDGDVSRMFTEAARSKWDLREMRQVTRVERDGEDVRAHLRGPDGDETVVGNALLVAVGRRSNSDRLNLAAADVAVHPDGRVAVDCHQRTSASHIFALGDVSSAYQLKHVANHEARVVAHNLLHPDEPEAADHRFVPHAVFTSPQIASVGLTEQGARDADVPFIVGRCDFSAIAYGWAMNDPEGFAKVLADPHTGLLLGAHVIGPEASVLVQPLIQAMSLGQDARSVARGQYWIHPAMSELVENALLALDFPPRPQPGGK